VPREDTQFKKGNPGGPGRPRKDKCIPDLLRRIGEEKADLDDVDYTNLEAVMRVVYELALDGTQWAVNFIADRTEGKPTQQVDLQPDKPGITIVMPDEGQ